MDEAKTFNISPDNPFKFSKRETLIKSLVNNLTSAGEDQLQMISDILNKDREKEKRNRKKEETEKFVGTSEHIKNVLTQIGKVARTDLPVLIHGETGTGKGLAARIIHEQSPRKHRAFVHINCAAIPETLLEAEFFGYVRGAYTSAHTSKEGKIEIADGGTLFLDEALELPTNLQSKLLRFLDDQVVERVGSRESRKVDVRLITATNHDIESALSNGNLRHDFFHRLKVFSIHLLPLINRDGDKLVLANHFLEKLSEEMEIPVQGYSESAIESINGYSWPGNVREMINKISRALVMNHPGRLLSAEDLELVNPQTIAHGPLKEMKLNKESELIAEVLIRNNFNISRTARALRISRPHLYNLMKKYGIKRE